MTLDHEDIEAIAEAVTARLRWTDQNQMLRCSDAAKILNVEAWSLTKLCNRGLVKEATKKTITSPYKAPLWAFREAVEKSGCRLRRDEA